MTKCGIYKITSPTGKPYIGQAVDIERRWKSYYALNNCHTQLKLYRSFQKYGPQFHLFEIVEECDINQLNERELYWGEKYDVLNENGLNLRLGNAGGRMSVDVKEKITLSKRGHSCYLNKERGEKISNANKNKPKPLDFGETISKIKKGKPNIKNQKPKPIEFGQKYYKPILQYDLKNSFIKEWPSIKEASKLLNISSGSISHCCRGKIKYTHNYIFKFK
jgi:group I intron endonuclease